MGHANASRMAVVDTKAHPVDEGEPEDPIPQGWAKLSGPSPVPCCLCGSAKPHSQRQSLWFFEDGQKYVVCMFRHIQHTFNVIGGVEPFQPVTPPMDDTAYAMFLIKNGEKEKVKK